MKSNSKNFTFPKIQGKSDWGKGNICIRSYLNSTKYLIKEFTSYHAILQVSYHQTDHCLISCIRTTSSSSLLHQ